MTRAALRRFPVLSVSVAAALAGGCSGPAPPSADQAGDTGVAATDTAEAPDSVAPLALGDLRPASSEGQATRGFSHAPHGEVACSACHGAVPGHDTHRDVACADCHEPPAGALPTANPTPAQCLACHHDPARAEPCTRCHGASSGLAARALPVNVEIRAAGLRRARSLEFQHATHDAIACESCHGTPPTRASARDCSECHVDHHEPTRRCMSCHAPPPPEAHTDDAHRSCAAAGCHEDAAIARLTPTRSVCLVCHQEQADHEPGGECASCHRGADSFARGRDGEAEG